MDSSNTGKGYSDYMVASQQFKSLLEEFEGQPTGESQVYEIKRKLEEKLAELEKRYMHHDLVYPVKTAMEHDVEEYKKRNWLK